MGFFDRKKKDKKLSDAAEIMELHIWFKTQIEETEHIPKASNKLLKLEGLKKDIDDKLFQREGAIMMNSRKEGVLTELSITTANVSIFMSACIIMGGVPLAALALFPIGLLGGSYMQLKTTDSAYKKLQIESLNYTEILKHQRDVISEIESRIINTHLEEIANSPIRGYLFEKHKNIKELFAEAAARKITGGDKPSLKKPFDGPKR